VTAEVEKRSPYDFDAVGTVTCVVAGGVKGGLERYNESGCFCDGKGKPNGLSLMVEIVTHGGLCGDWAEYDFQKEANESWQFNATRWDSSKLPL
jgi:hypothetical protein